LLQIDLINFACSDVKELYTRREYSKENRSADRHIKLLAQQHLPQGTELFTALHWITCYVFTMIIRVQTGFVSEPGGERLVQYGDFFLEVTF
jgi:hypothetical protein